MRVCGAFARRFSFGGMGLDRHCDCRATGCFYGNEATQDPRLVLRRGRSGRNGIDSGLHRRVSRQRDDWFGGGVAYGWRPTGSERPP